MPWISSH